MDFWEIWALYKLHSNQVTSQIAAAGAVELADSLAEMNKAIFEVLERQDKKLDALATDLHEIKELLKVETSEPDILSYCPKCGAKAMYRGQKYFIKCQVPLVCDPDNK